MIIKLDLQIEVDEPIVEAAIAAFPDLLRMIADQIETDDYTINDGAAFLYDYSNGSTIPADIGYDFNLVTETILGA